MKNVLKKSKFLLLALAFLSSLAYGAFDPDMSMTEWIETCKNLSKNRTKNDCRDVSKITVKDSAFGADRVQAWKAFNGKMQETISLIVAQLNQAAWLGDRPKCAENLGAVTDFNQAFQFQPYAQKLDLEPKDELIFHGDFHGDCHSLMLELEQLKKDGYLNDQFKIIKPNVRMVFLGDYVDRGLHGAEVMFTLFRLKLANPEMVCIVRGNHEDVNIAVQYGFFHECLKKFSNEKQEFSFDMLYQFANLYEILPVVLYVGCDNNYLQCCHGGMEPGYNPLALLNNQERANHQLIGELNRTLFVFSDREYQRNDARKNENYVNVKQLPSPFHERETLGFMWNDFLVQPQLHGNYPGENENINSVIRNKRASVSFSKLATKELLDLQNEKNTKIVRGVFRAHQHESDLRSFIMAGLKHCLGVFELWRPFNSSLKRKLSEGLVWTFNVAPDTIYGQCCQFDFYAYAHLTVAESYDDWQLRVVNLQDRSPEDIHDESPAEAGAASAGGGGSKTPTHAVTTSARDPELGQSTSFNQSEKQQLVQKNPADDDKRWLLTRLMYWLLSRPKTLVYWLLSFISK